MITEVDVLSEIERIARDELLLEGALDPDADLSSGLALDSVSRITLAVGLEDRFRIRLNEDDARARTPRELAVRVVARVHDVEVAS